MSRFVAEGSAQDYQAPKTDDWAKAEEQIKASKKPKLEVGQQEGGKSLYDVLQANKAAKQEAFEEKTKLSNQFRNLDEDEIEFLDSMMESTRAKEREIRKETNSSLASFRKQQEEAEKKSRLSGTDETPVEDAASWSAPRKRKRVDNQRNQLKVRKSSTDQGTPEIPAKHQAQSGSVHKKSPASEAGAGQAFANKDEPHVRQATAVSKSLVDYGSDSDD